MFEKFSSKVSEIYQFNVDELISGFDEKTQNSVKKLIKEHKISFSALNPNYDASARALGFFLCDIYRKAVEDWKSSPTVDFFYDGREKKLFDIEKEQYAKLPKKFRGLYQYDASIDKYRPRGNVDVSTHPGSLILKYKKGADKKQIQSLISSLDVLYNNGKLKELFQVLSQLSKLTKVENIVDKRRDAENSGSTFLAQELYNENEQEGSLLRGYEEIIKTNSEVDRAKRQALNEWSDERWARTKTYNEDLNAAKKAYDEDLNEVEAEYQEDLRKIEEKHEKALKRVKGKLHAALHEVNEEHKKGNEERIVKTLDSFKAAEENGLDRKNGIIGLVGDIYRRCMGRGKK